MTAAPAWVEISLQVEQEWQELFAEHLCELTAGGVAFGRTSLAEDPIPVGHARLRAYVLEERLDGRQRQHIEDALLSLAKRIGSPVPLSIALRWRRLPPEDWTRSWEKTWKPFRIGKLCVVPPGFRAALRLGDRRLVLEPGGAFGTGRHPTTRQCLQALQERVGGGERLLDAGTGNGILACAAGLWGANYVLAFDLDPNALPYAQRLVAQNGMQAVIDLRQGGFELLAGLDGTFDGLTANIYSDLVRAHAPDLARMLVPRGWFILSGCHRDQRSLCLTSLEAAGLGVLERRSRGSWDTFLGRRRE